MLRPLLTFLCASILLTTAAISQDKKPPANKEIHKILYSVPLVAKTGEKQKIALQGKGLAAVKEVKVVGAEGAKVKVLGAKAVGVPNNYPADRMGNSEVEVELELPKEVKQGEVKLIAVGADGGESPPYALLLRDELPTIAEKEPNDGFEQAQAISIPSAIEGAIKGERDVDVFKFEGKKGARIRIEMQAARFGSPLDPLLTLYDSQRRSVDCDGDAASADPILNATLPKDGNYYIVAMDANDLGGPNFGYRLIVRPSK